MGRHKIRWSTDTRLQTPRFLQLTEATRGGPLLHPTEALLRVPTRQHPPPPFSQLHHSLSLWGLLLPYQNIRAAAARPSSPNADTPSSCQQPQRDSVHSILSPPSLHHLLLFLHQSLTPPSLTPSAFSAPQQLHPKCKQQHFTVVLSPPRGFLHLTPHAHSF